MNDSDRGYDRGPPREELPLPTVPPYTAFIGNLSFDVREQEVEDFFLPSKVSSAAGGRKEYLLTDVCSSAQVCAWSAAPMDVQRDLVTSNSRLWTVSRML